jgi:hypothetical protein
MSELAVIMISLCFAGLSWELLVLADMLLGDKKK